jgi:hypothetical protein
LNRSTSPHAPGAPIGTVRARRHQFPPPASHISDSRCPAHPRKPSSAGLTTYFELLHGRRPANFLCMNTGSRSRLSSDWIYGTTSRWPGNGRISSTGCSRCPTIPGRTGRSSPMRDSCIRTSRAHDRITGLWHREGHLLSVALARLASNGERLGYEGSFERD